MEIEMSTIIKSYLNWDMLSRYQKMSLNFMDKFKSYINWDLVLQNQRLDENVLIHIIKDKDINVNFCVLIQYQRLSETFIIEYFDMLNIDLLAKYQTLPDSIIESNEPINLNWYIITKYQPLHKIIKDNLPINRNIVLSELLKRKLNKEFILLNFKILTHRYKKIICKYQDLNNDILFQIDFSFYIDTILRYQRLSENILHDMIYFYDNIDFDMIFKYQKISGDFIFKYQKFKKVENYKKKYKFIPFI